MPTVALLLSLLALFSFTSTTPYFRYKEDLIHSETITYPKWTTNDTSIIAGTRRSRRDMSSARSIDLSKVSRMLYQLKRVLRSFIEKRYFNTVDFGMALSRIRLALIDVESLIRERFVSELDLLEELNNTKEIFREMVNFNEFCKIKIPNWKKSDSIYCKVCELRIEILGLFTVDGIPDFEIDNLDEIVDRLERRYLLLKATSAEVSSPISIYKLILAIEFNKIAVSLRVLKGQMYTIGSEKEPYNEPYNDTKAISSPEVKE